MKAPLKFYRGAKIRYIPPDEEWLKHHYLILDKSITKIAQEVGSSRFPVHGWLRAHGIQKPRKQLAKAHSDLMSGKGNPAWGGGHDRRYHKNVLLRSDRPYQCKWCGHKKRLEVHHHDHDIANGSLDNLAWLCRYCNHIEAGLWHLQQKGRADILIEANQITIRFNT